MGKHISKSLFSGYRILSSNEDQSTVMDIYVGFNTSHQLVITIEYSDYEDAGNNCSTAAIVNTDDAYRMAFRHKVEFRGLPLFISECMADWSEIRNPRFRQIRNCFKEITECLLDECCRFRIVRTYNRHNTPCY